MSSPGTKLLPLDWSRRLKAPGCPAGWEGSGCRADLCRAVPSITLDGSVEGPGCVGTKPSASHPAIVHTASPPCLPQAHDAVCLPQVFVTIACATSALVISLQELMGDFSS